MTYVTISVKKKYSNNCQMNSEYIYRYLGFIERKSYQSLMNNEIE